MISFACAPDAPPTCDAPDALDAWPSVLQGTGADGAGEAGNYRVEVDPVSLGDYRAIVEVDGYAPVSLPIQVVDQQVVMDYGIGTRWIAIGDTMRFSPWVENRGAGPANATLELFIDGVLVDAETRTILPDEDDQRIPVSAQMTTAGRFPVELRLAQQSLHGEIVVQPGAPEFELSAFVLQPSTHVGEPASIEALLTNVGDAIGSTTLEYLVDGAPQENEPLYYSQIWPGESVEVDLWYTPNAAGTYEILLRADDSEAGGTLVVTEPPHATFHLTDLLVPPDALLGSPVTVQATLHNVGEGAGTASIRLVVNNATRDARLVEVAPGSSEPVSFTFTPTVAGLYTVSFASTTEVLGPAPLLVRAPSAAFSLGPLDAPAQGYRNEPVPIRVQVRNDGDAAGDATVILLVNNAQRASSYVPLGPGESADVQLAFSTGVAGTYHVAIRVGSVLTDTRIVEIISRPEPRFVISDLVVPARAGAGALAQVQVTIANQGDAAGIGWVDWALDGHWIGTTEALLAPSESMVHDLSFVPEDAGSHILTAEAASGTLGATLIVLPKLHVRTTSAEASPLVEGASELSVADAVDLVDLRLSIQYDPSALAFAGIAPAKGLHATAVDDAVNGTLHLRLTTAERGPIDGEEILASLSWSARRLDTQTIPLDAVVVEGLTEDGVAVAGSADLAPVHTSLLGDAPNAVLTPLSDALNL